MNGSNLSLITPSLAAGSTVPGTVWREPSRARGGLISRRRFLNEAIVALAILQMLLSVLIAPFELLQGPVELVLIAALLYGCTTVKLHLWDVVLFSVLLVVTTASSLSSDLTTVLINTKQNGLAVVSLIYLSKVRFRSHLILPAFLLSLALMVVNRFIPEATAGFSSFSSKEGFNQVRFGGLFLNTHFNAYFMAAVLIAWIHERRLVAALAIYLGGLYIVYISDSKIVMLSYLTNLASRLPLVSYVAKNRLVTAAVAVAGVVLVVNNGTWFIQYFNTDKLRSASVVIAQVVDPAYYGLLLNPLPRGPFDVADQAMIRWRGHEGDVEVGYFVLAVQCGIILAVPYLLLLLKHAPNHRIFILVSLLHYGFITSPLITYLLVSYARTRRHGRRAGRRRRRSSQPARPEPAGAGDVAPSLASA